MENPIIELSNVEFSYDKQVVLSDVSLQIRRGAFLPFVGPNGAGKTTLLRVILGLLKPSRGIVKTPFESKSPGYVTQLKTIDPIFPVTIRQIIEMGLYPELGLWHRPSPAQNSMIDGIMSRFSLLEHQHKTYGELSGGMKQKTILARALVGRPEVVVMDEPTSELDEKAESDFLNFLASLSHDEGLTVLIAHHGMDQAATLAEGLCVVNRGRVSIEAGKKPNGNHEPCACCHCQSHESRGEQNEHRP